MNHLGAIYKFLWVLAGVLCIVLAIVIFGPPIRRQDEMQKRKNELKEETRKLRADTDELLTKQERFKTDPEFVEETAKREGMVRTNDVVIKFND